MVRGGQTSRLGPKRVSNLFSLCVIRIGIHPIMSYLNLKIKYRETYSY